MRRLQILVFAWLLIVFTGIALIAADGDVSTVVDTEEVHTDPNGEFAVTMWDTVCIIYIRDDSDDLDVVSSGIDGTDLSGDIAGEEIRATTVEQIYDAFTIQGGDYSVVCYDTDALSYIECYETDSAAGTLGGTVEQLAISAIDDWRYSQLAKVEGDTIFFVQGQNESDGGDGWLRSGYYNRTTGDLTINALVEYSSGSVDGASDLCVAEDTSSTAIIAGRSGSGNGVVYTWRFTHGTGASEGAVDTLKYEDDYTPTNTCIDWKEGSDYYLFGSNYVAVNPIEFGTVEISNAGVITGGADGPPVDTLVTNVTETLHDLKHVAGDVFAYIGVDGDGYGWLKTRTVNESGVISAVVDSLKFEGSACTTGKITVTGHAGSAYNVIVTYCNADGTDRVYQKSVTIEASTGAEEEGWAHRMNGKVPGKINGKDAGKILSVNGKRK